MTSNVSSHDLGYPIMFLFFDQKKNHVLIFDFERLKIYLLKKKKTIYDLTTILICI